MPRVPSRKSKCALPNAFHGMKMALDRDLHCDIHIVCLRYTESQPTLHPLPHTPARSVSSLNGAKLGDLSTVMLCSFTAIQCAQFEFSIGTQWFAQRISHKDYLCVLLIHSIEIGYSSSSCITKNTNFLPSKCLSSEQDVRRTDGKRKKITETRKARVILLNVM